MISKNNSFSNPDNHAREAVAIFHDEKFFNAAIRELYRSGFSQSDISLLASEKAIEKKLGHRLENVSEYEDDFSVPRSIHIEQGAAVEAKTAAIGGLAYIGAMTAVGTMVASGGTLAVALVAAAIGGGAGGLVGSALAGWMGHHHSHHLETQLSKGGLLLWVSLMDADLETKALQILKKHAGDDVHVHNVPRHDAPESNPFSGMSVDPFLPGSRV